MVPQDTLSIALDCLKAHPNWFLFPIKRGEKYPPLIPDNLNLASNNPLQIRKMHATWRGCNWGLSLAKSKLVVVDGDMKPGKVGEATLENLYTRHGAFPDTYIVRTPSGGFHFYFNEANGVTHKCRLGVSGFGKDVDSPNYVLLAGCGLLDTTMYEAINDAPVAPSPAWFGLYLRESNMTDADQTPVADLDTDTQIAWAVHFLTHDAKPSVIGSNGENALLMTAAVLKDHGISEDKAIELLFEHYNVPKAEEGERPHPYCDPLWSGSDGAVEDRLDVKVHNAWLYLKETAPGAFTAAAEFDGQDEPEDWGDGYETVEDGVSGIVTRSAKLHSTVTPEVIEQWQQVHADRRTAKENEKKAADTRERRARDKREKASIDAAEAEAVAEAARQRAESDDDNSWLTGDEEDTSWLDPDPDTDPDPDPAPKPPKEPEPEDPEPSTNLEMRALGNISEKDKPTNIAELCQRWVWITGIERFVNRLTPKLNWKAKQFDSEFNYLTEKASLANQLFKKKDILRRFRHLAFRPGGPEFSGSEYNVWRSSGIGPKPGDTTLWNEHLNYLFQNVNDKNAILNWMAWIVQNPTLKPNHALLIVGRHTGTGKSFIARVFEQIIGENNTQRPKNSSMGGDFNSWLINCRLCIIEEMYQVNRRENFNALRDLITEPTVEVNMKGVPAFTIPNFACMLGISNHPDALPLDEYDRRWMVNETYARPREPEYYDRLFAGIPKARGVKPENPDMVPAILQELLDRDIAAFPLIEKDGTITPYDGYVRPPETAAKTAMIELSRSDAESWLIENAGNIPLKRNVVQVSDITEAMPTPLLRTPRLTTAVIPNFLGDKLNGVRHPEPVHLSDGRRVRVWVLHNRYSMIDAKNLGAVYESERKADNKKMDEQWADEEDSAS